MGLGGCHLNNFELGYLGYRNGMTLHDARPLVKSV